MCIGINRRIRESSKRGGNGGILPRHIVWRGYAILMPSSPRVAYHHQRRLCMQSKAGGAPKLLAKHEAHRARLGIGNLLKRFLRGEALKCRRERRPSKSLR